MALFDLTRTIEHGMPVYPGDPAVSLHSVSRVEPDGFANSALSTGMHAGTHMDGPGHFLPDGKRLTDIPVERFLLPAILIDASHRSEIGPEILDGHPVLEGGALLIRTGWDRRFRHEDYFHSHPVLTPSLAEILVERGVSMLGLDTPSPDRTPHAIHRVLLGAGVLVLENLTGLERLPTGAAFRLMAFPLKVDADSAPARVLADVSQVEKPLAKSAISL